MPVADFSVKFLIQRNSGTVAIRITDDSSGFSDYNGNVSITYPDGHVSQNTDFNNADINAQGGTVDYAVRYNASLEPLNGEYIISYTVKNDALTESETEAKTFTFTWDEPNPSLTDTSVVYTPTVKFKDETDYSASGWTPAYNTWTIEADAPTTSDENGNSVSHNASTGDRELDAAFSTYYYEGVYSTTITLDIDYTHDTYSYLSLNFTQAATESFTINGVLTISELIDGINVYKGQLSDGEKETYDYILALYLQVKEASFYGVTDQTIADAAYDELVTLINLSNSSGSYQAGPIGSVGTAAGSVSGSGSANRVAKFSGSTVLANSIMTDNGSLVSVAGDLSATGTITATTGIIIGSDTIAEYIQDTVDSLIQDANGVTWTYDDVGATLTPDFALDTSKVTSGTFADDRIAETNVTQHEAALAIAATQLTGNMPDARIIASNVTQHEALLTITESQISDLGTYQPTSEKGNANGYASLDGGGKVPASQLPSSVMEYQGTWNASTNTPTLIDGTGDNGDVYRVSVAGTQDLGSGNIEFKVGDWAVYNGTVWEVSGNSDAVTTVFGREGDVVAAASDYDADQIDFTAYSTITSTDVQSAIEELKDEVDALVILEEGTAESISGVWNFSNGFQVGGNETVSGYDVQSATADSDFNAGTVYFIKFGNIVVISFETLTCVSNNDGPFTSTGFIPSGFRPSGDVSVVYGHNTDGLYEATARNNGQIRFFFKDWGGNGINQPDSVNGGSIVYYV